jgi:hypothetical protein
VGEMITRSRKSMFTSTGYLEIREDSISIANIYVTVSINHPFSSINVDPWDLCS